MLELEQVTENFNSYMDLCTKVGKRKDVANTFIDHFGERLAACPASTKKSYSGAYPGGLIEANLNILKCALKINSVFELGVKKSSILFCCLFRNIGMLGTKDDELLIEQESEWHRDKLGEMYKYNKGLEFMTPADRTIFLMQEFGFVLSHDEYLALRLTGTKPNEEYSMSEGKLAFIISTASRIVTFESEKR